jgi:ribose transport system permease protein
MSSTDKSESRNSARKNDLHALLTGRNTATVGAALLLFVFFSLISDSFLTPFNLFNVGRTLSLYVFIALSQAMAILVSGLNISTGAIGGLATITVGHFMANMGVSPVVAVPAALAVGSAAGFVNGFLMTKLKLHAFIITLATSFLFTGIVYGISKGYPYTEIPEAFTVIGRGRFLEFPILFWVMVATLLVNGWIFKYTVFGRHILSTGGNLEAARLSGIETDRMVTWAHVLSGFYAALAGVLWVSRMGTAQPATGQSWLLISFAVAIIGGTALTGGVISFLGIFAGGVIMVLIKNGLILLEANVYFEQAFLGAIVLLTVSLGSIREIVSAALKRRSNEPARRKGSN